MKTQLAPAAAQRQREYEALRLIHRCIRCKEQPVIYGGIYCPKCQAEHEENMKEEAT